MEDEEFLILDDDQEPETPIPEIKSDQKKLIKSGSKHIISSISKNVENKFYQIKESNELKKLLDDGKENLISFSRC